MVFAGTVVAYRVLAGTASMATVLLVAHTARRLRPGSAAFAVVMVGVNPAVVFLTVGSGHNDALVALSIYGGYFGGGLDRWRGGAECHRAGGRLWGRECGWGRADGSADAF